MLPSRVLGFDPLVWENTVMNLTVSYDQREQVKNRGAKWNQDLKKWQIDGRTFAQDQDFWMDWSPSIVLAEETASCPF